MPASRSRSASSTFWFCAAQFAATWQTSVVAPQPPLAEKKAECSCRPPWRRRRAAGCARAERLSSARRSGSSSGGKRYSLMPARMAARIASASAVVFSAMIMGSPMALRIDETRPSSGSLQPLISTSTTSGPHALQAVQKVAEVADVLVLHDDAKRQLGADRPGSAPRVPGSRSPSRWSADT